MPDKQKSSDKPQSLIPNGSRLLPNLRALAASGTAKLRTNSQWEAWLHRAERFSSFGFTNTMLIWAQDPDAVLLKTYPEWRKLGRQVMAESAGIRLIVAGKDDAARVETFFDLLQTEGKPVRMPQPRSALDDTGADGHVWETLGSLAEREGFRVTKSAQDSAVNWSDRVINIRADEDRVAALAHQVGHILLGHRGPDGAGLVHASVCQGARKVEADSVTFLIDRRFGMDTSGITFPSITSWAGTDPRADRARIIAAAGDRITAAASKSFACIDVGKHALARATGGARRAAVATKSPAIGRTAISPLSAARERTRMIALVQAEALRFFTSQVGHSWVPSYLEWRGLGPATRRDWCAGYAPATWTAVTDHLREEGFPDEAIEASGLASRTSRRTLIDTFRDRAVFPVRAPDGTVLGFIGRAAPDAGQHVPKYLNTRETETYHKGRVLFGLHEGREALAAGACPVIVEGPLDAIAVTEAGAGRYAGVAPCGTAFTAEQVGELVRACDLRKTGVLAAFDADSAGQKAAVRAYDLLSSVADRPMTITFSAGHDPAGVFAEHGGEALRLALGNLARPLADIVIDARIAKFASALKFIDGKLNALDDVAPVIARMTPVEWPRQAIRVSARIGLTPTEVSDAVIRAMPDGGDADARAGPSQARAAQQASRDVPIERQRSGGIPPARSAQSPDLAADSKGVPRNRPGSYVLRI